MIRMNGYNRLLNRHSGDTEEEISYKSIQVYMVK